MKVPYLLGNYKEDKLCSTMRTKKMGVDHQFLEQDSVLHFQLVLHFVVPA